MPRQPAHPGQQRYPAEPGQDRRHAHEAPPDRPAPQRIPAAKPKHARPAEPATSHYAQSAQAGTALAEPEQPESKESANARLLRDSGSIAIATLVSRITGFGKQLLLLAVLGPAVASSFVSANLIPNMIAELVLGAVLTAIVVPTLIRAEQEDDDNGAAFVRRLVTAAFTVLAVAALLATAAAPILATHVFVSADGKVNTELTTALTFLLVPAILFYGMSALLTAILNTRQAFRPGAWAPVLNNVVVLIMLGAYALTPGEISLNPVSMGDSKLLVLGLGVTTGVFVQAASLLPAIRRHGIDLRPLWGIDARLKQFGRMGIAIILYVLISQVGLIVANNISSHADEAGPAIYSNAWLLLQLPYGVLGVTLLTAIMPRLSRNAAADDTPAVVDDLSVATRLTMIALVPVVVFLTLAGPQVGQALFGYARFAEDAERLGLAVSWSAFALIPYSMVLIHLRVFYAREQAWTPTWIVLGITAVKIVFSALAPVLSSDSSHVVIMLGAANGLGYTAGAIIGGYLLHRSLGDLRMANVGRTVSRVALAAIAGGAVMLIVDRVLGLGKLSEAFGGPGSLIRVAILAVVMFGVAFGLMRLAGIPEIVAITVAVSRRLGITPPAPDLDLDAKVDEGATRVLQRRDQYEYPRFDPYGDSTQTMVLPVIRPDAVGRTGSGHFPYPVRQRSTSGDDETSTYPSEGGPRVSDDAVGGVPADDSPGNRPAGLSTEHRPADQPPQQEQGGRVPPQAPVPGAPPQGVPPRDAEATVRIGPGDLPPAAVVPPGAQPDTGSAHAHPPRDPMYDTGMLPIPPVGGEQGPGRRIPRGPKLIPGASVAGGRYRLLADCGGSRGLKFWQALDIKLDREVALTFVDADQKSGENSGQDGPQAILSRTLRLGRINSPGLARVLDVVRGSSGGIVVAEWTPGRSLREMAETVPSPIGAARAIRVLASAAELAHRGGGALSIDHPDRVRISASGDAVLAFPGTLSDADAQGDVRGLGAMLYALILARWPIRSGGLSGQAATVGGLRLADFGADGTPVEPRQVRPEVPFEISAVAVRSLESNKGVRTAATVQHVLEQASVVDQKTDFIPVLRLGQRQQPPVEESLADPELLAAERERSQRMLWIMVGLGILAALVVGIVIWWTVSMFAGGEPSEPLDKSNNIGLTSETTAPPAAPIGPAEPAANGSAGAPVPATAIGVFSPEGTPDGTGSADAVIDRDPSSTWRTDQYFQQFPALKKGVGLLATLPTPARLNSVAIESPSAGTTVEIRTSPTESPTLDQTQLIGSARLQNGVTDIPVRTDQAARYVLVWITGLGNDGGRFQTTIGELRFDAAP
ncbi:lipid II flippase MurJ [Nocardia jiangsuensis]|uniref:Lipid II flippase MurJ n=1 Tax=Nocardia jiangsuensis TaxID=1691563 RepID=A0ABV8DVK2_9NOCA